MDADPRDASLSELFASGAICLPSHRQGWDGSRIDGQQREYIIDREAVMEVMVRITKVGWQSVNCEDKRLALLIIENVRHSLGVMLREMSENERRML